MNCCKIILATTAACLLAGLVRTAEPEAVQLADGQVIRGPITSQDDKLVLVRTGPASTARIDRRLIAG